MAWEPMSPEKAKLVLDSAPPYSHSPSAPEFKQRREAALMLRGDLSPEEIRVRLEPEFGPLD
jgi:hypothetical protein